MPSNLLDQLKNHSVVVADTGDLEAIRRFAPQDATTNPSLIFKAVQSGGYDELLGHLLEEVCGQEGAGAHMIEDLSDRLIVAMGRQILQRVPGRVSTEVDARLAYDAQACIAKARRLIALYEQAGVGRERVLIKLAATWEGIRAAQALEREGIHCNLTLVFNFCQAQACAEAGVYLISPFVGRILDWHRKAHPQVEYVPAEEPGVLSVQRIHHYFRRHGYSTQVMGASFRNLGEILALAGCDRLTIAPALLEELAATEGALVPALFREPVQAPQPQVRLGEAEFRHLMQQDLMASEQLREGIRGFEVDQVRLESLLRDRLLKGPA